MSSTLNNTIAWMLPFLLLGTAVVGVPMLMFDSKGLPRYQALSSELHRVENVNDKLERDVQRLEHQVKALKTDRSAIEAIARDELGMIYEGEIVFQFNR
ncbi:MAG: septum formation initiator family protein [Myxococcales bacterium]|nr:MAG: septum formation initiator family protein [Myxococcales bacterium]